MKKGIVRYLKNHFGDSLAQKNIVITGANSGIGYALSEELLYLGANIVMACRNLKKAEVAKTSLLKQYPNAKITLYQLDVSSFDSIDGFLKQIIKDEIKIDAFFNNAGVFRLNQSYNEQNIEMVMATNLIGPYYLNKKLISSLNDCKYLSKIIFVTSLASYFNPIDYEDPFFSKHYRKLKMYAATKRGIVHVFRHFLTTNKNQNLQFFLTHPGVSYTPIFNKGYHNHIFQKYLSFCIPLLFHSSYKAALSYIMTLQDKENGAYYGPRFFLGTRGYPKRKQIRKSLLADEDKTINLLNRYIKN